MLLGTEEIDMRKIVSMLLIVALINFMVPSFLQAGEISSLQYGSGAIRSMTRMDDGTILGGRSSGHAIEVWSSTNNGSNWSRIGTVASNTNINYGDVMFLAVPNTTVVYCAFREFNAENKYAVVVCRSDNGGKDWIYDSTVIAGCSEFVGAPWLFIAENGDMQCYYDSEPLATENGVRGAQWIAMQGRNGRSGEWNKYGVVAASRDANASKFVRDGMASVVDLGNNRIMVVTEGIEDAQSGGVYSNVVRAIQSFDGGKTWDYSGRRIVYQCGTDAASGRRYNAFCPMAIRVGNGPVGVVFCTDEDFGGTPDLSSEVVSKRRTHIKYVRTLSSFEEWGGKVDIWTDGSQAYAPGMIETASNELLISIDHFAGHQRFLKYDVLKNNEAEKKTIDGGIEINGYQISAVSEGMRTVYSVDSKINDKQVVRSGLIYSLADYAAADQLYVGNDNYYVKNYDSTEKGKLEEVYSESDIATSYAMTMKFATKSMLEFGTEFRLCAYAELEDGTLVYSKPVTYKIFNVADSLYQNRKMSNASSHNYLYNEILVKVNPDYKEISY